MKKGTWTSDKKGKTFSEIYGDERAKDIKLKISNKIKSFNQTGKSNIEKYGEEKAREISLRISKSMHGNPNVINARINMWKNGEYRKKISIILHNAMIGRKRPDISASRLGMRFSEEHKKALKKAQNDPEVNKRRAESISKANKNERTKALHRKAILDVMRRTIFIKNHVTKIEKKVRLELTRLGKNFIFQYCLEDKFLYDFFIPEDGLLVECDGDYWHSLEKAKINDAKKNELAKEHGFSLLRLPEKLIMKENFNLEFWLNDFKQLKAGMIEFDEIPDEYKILLMKYYGMG